AGTSRVPSRQYRCDMQEVLRSPGDPGRLYPGQHSGFRPRADSVPVADSNQFERRDFRRRLKVSAAKLLIIFKSSFGQAFHTELHPARLHIEWERLEVDAPPADRRHCEADSILAGISDRNRFDVIHIWVLTAEV